VQIQEYEVEPSFLERLDASALTRSDMEALEAPHPVRPSRWHDYLEERHWKHSEDGSLWHEEFPPVIPFAVIDRRLMYLAIDFWSGADARLLDGYRRLAGNVYLRSLLIECANHILRPRGKDSSLRRWGLHLADRGGKQAKNRAVVAVARKLAILLHHIWTTQEPYMPFYAEAA
jgi:hypothetical protein